MTKYIGQYSALRGPRGKALTEYLLENIPELWSRAIEPITGVTNTGAAYVGTVEDLFLADSPEFVLPVTIPTDKPFWFTPHVANLANATLSLSDNRGHTSPFYPIIRNSGAALLANDLYTTKRYLLLFSGSAFRVIGDGLEGVNTLGIQPQQLGLLPSDTANFNSKISDAIDLAVSSGLGLHLSEDFHYNAPFDKEISGRLVIRGPGKFVAGPGVTGTTGFRLSGEYVPGALSVEFPLGGETLVAQAPNAEVLESIVASQTLYWRVSDISDFAVGQLVRVQQLRLFGEDHRNSTLFGEVLRVRSIGKGPNILANPQFYTDTVWSKDVGWTIAGDKAVFTADPGNANDLFQTPTFTPSATYWLKYVLSGVSGAGSIYPRFVGGVEKTGILRTANGTYEETIIADAGSSGFRFTVANPTSLNVSVDDVELREVGNFIEFETVPTFGYQYGPIISGTAAAGSASSITIATGLDANLVKGCRIRITGGTGAGQQKFIVAYDSATGVCTFGTASDFTTPPDNTSVYIVDCKTFLFAINPLELIIKDDFGFDHSSAGVCFKHLELAGCYHADLAGLRLSGGNPLSSHGIDMPDSYECDVDRLYAEKVGEDDGHSLGLMGTRNFVSRSRAWATRRGGADSSGSLIGTIPDVNSTVENCDVVGALRGENGFPYDNDRRNYAYGEHGNCYGRVFRNNRSSGGFVYPFILRGMCTIIDGHHHDGEWAGLIRLVAGRAPIINGMRAHVLSMPEILPRTATPLFSTQRYGIIADATWTGPDLKLKDWDVDGLTSSLIRFNRATNAEFIPGKLILSDIDLTVYTDSAFYLFTSDQASILLNEAEFDRINVRVVSPAGTGYFGGIGAVWGSGDGVTPTWIRWDDTYHFYIPDDKVVKIPFTQRQNKIGVKVFPEGLNADFFGHVIFRGATGVIDTDLGPAAINFNVITTIPTGTTGTDTDVNLFFDGEFVHIENRRGSTITGRAQFF